MSWQATGIAALVLAISHIAGAHARPSSPRLRSFAGGVGVAYVFAVILPLLSDWQGVLRDEQDAERLIFLVALAGLAGFYVVEHGALALDKRKRSHAAAWVQIGGFILYSLAVGFVLADYGERSLIWLMGYTGAIGLHFYMNARSTMTGHEQPVLGKWLMSGAVLTGWAVGCLLPHHYQIANMLFAGMAGAMILSIMTHELPTQDKATPGAFLTGVILVTVLSLIS